MIAVVFNALGRGSVGVRIISKSRLRDFWQTPGREDSKPHLEAWYKVVRRCDWGNWGAVKQTYANASKVGDCVVFNIFNNHYRLVVRIRYQASVVYTLRVMTHGEYDKEPWKEQCGCFSPPPKRAKQQAARTPKSRLSGKKRPGREQ